MRILLVTVSRKVGVAENLPQVTMGVTSYVCVHVCGVILYVLSMSYAFILPDQSKSWKMAEGSDTQLYPHKQTHQVSSVGPFWIFKK